LGTQQVRVFVSIDDQQGFRVNTCNGCSMANDDSSGEAGVLQVLLACMTFKLSLSALPWLTPSTVHGALVLAGSDINSSAAGISESENLEVWIWLCDLL